MDDIREIAFGSKRNAKHTRHEGKFLSSIFKIILAYHINEGKYVIIANTYLRASHIKRDVGYILSLGVDKSIIEIVDFHLSFDEILKRNRARSKEDKVPEDLLRDWNYRFNNEYNWLPIDTIVANVLEKKNKPKFAPIKIDDSLAKCFVFDMDGTLAYMGDRSPYSIEVINDGSNTNIINLAKMTKAQGYGVIISSGRSIKAKEQTIAWLEKYGVEFDAIYMRAEDDMRGDEVVKYEFAQEIASAWNIETWFDDRNKVVNMLRKAFEGRTTVIQVAEGDF